MSILDSYNSNIIFMIYIINLTIGLLIGILFVYWKVKVTRNINLIHLIIFIFYGIGVITYTEGEKYELYKPYQNYVIELSNLEDKGYVRSLINQDDNLKKIFEIIDNNFNLSEQEKFEIKYKFYDIKMKDRTNHDIVKD